MGYGGVGRRFGERLAMLWAGENPGGSIGQPARAVHEKLAARPARKCGSLKHYEGRYYEKRAEDAPWRFTGP
jgi:hypothetical protein